MKNAGGIELDLLTLAQQGYKSAEFIKNASILICEYFDCSGLDLFIREGSRESTWLLRKTGGGGYSFIRGEEEAERTGLRVPFTIDESGEGCLTYHRKSGSLSFEKDAGEYGIVSDIFGKVVFFRDSRAALHERIKELTCLYEITKIMHMSRGRIEETLHDVVKNIPGAFQYMDSASSRIVLDGSEYVCGDTAGSLKSLRSDITIAGSVRGIIEVCYQIADPELDEMLFLPEEQNLLDGIAKQLSLLLEEQEAALERVKLEDQLRHADRLATIGQLAAGVAHEINEPLANILGFSELIKKDPDLSEQTMSDLDKIIRASMYARETVRKLLVFAGKIQPGVMEVNLNSIIREGLQFLEMRCKKSVIELQIDLDPDLPPITADPGQMNQLFINLLVNSIQALPDGGRIHILTGVKDRMVFMSVEDNGSGIPEDVMDSIFLPFFTTKVQGEGTGLGLVVVHGIVRAYHGEIDVQSRVDDYTRFTICLPMKDAHE